MKLIQIMGNYKVQSEWPTNNILSIKYSSNQCFTKDWANDSMIFWWLSI